MVKQKLLVIGGGGFLGYHLINLLKNNYEIYNYDLCVEGFSFDNLHKDINRNYLPVTTFGCFSKLKYDSYNFRNCTADYSIERILEEFQPDLIINLASLSHVDTSISSPTSFIKYNVEKFVELLEIMKSRDIPLMHMSTDEIYGETWKGMIQFPYKPSSIYSQTKVSQEQIIEIYNRMYNQQFTIVRSTNLIGTHQDDKKFIPTVFRNIIQGNEVPLYGDGLQRRTWLSVEDASQLIRIVIDKIFQNKLINKAVTISNPYNYLYNKTAVEIIEEVFNDKGYKNLAYIKSIKDRPNHDRSYYLELSNELRGYIPLTGFKDIVRSIFDYYIHRYSK